MTIQTTKWKATLHFSEFDAKAIIKAVKEKVEIHLEIYTESEKQLLRDAILGNELRLLSLKHPQIELTEV